MRSFHRCPNCGLILLYLGSGKYTCTNPGCKVKRATLTNLSKVMVKETKA